MMSILEEGFKSKNGGYQTPNISNGTLKGVFREPAWSALLLVEEFNRFRTSSKQEEYSAKFRLLLRKVV